MALRMIVAWMALVAIVVFVALVAEIISTSHTVTVGDVVTDHPNCSIIGKEILADGGNGVDAAVAAGLCLAVTRYVVCCKCILGIGTHKSSL